MSRLLKVLAVAVLALSPTRANFADDAKSPAVYPAAILPFQERSEEVKGLGATVGDVLFAKLSASPGFYFVDRTDLAKTLEEQELSLSGVVKPNEAVRVGQLTGAKILITGSVVEIDRTLYLVAKIIGTETGRVAGASAKGKTSDDLSVLVEQLAANIEAQFKKEAKELIPKPAEPKDRVAAINRALGDKKRPKVWIQVAERHVGQPVIDPAAQTEITLLCKETGFEIIDTKEGNRNQADVIIEGEAFSEFAVRRNNLVTVKARLEIKAIDRATGKLVAADRQTEVVVDLAEQIAGKTALQQAAAVIAERLLPKLAVTDKKS